MAVILYLKTRLQRTPIPFVSLLLLLSLLFFFPALLLRQEADKREAKEKAWDTIPVDLVISDIPGTSTEHLALPGYMGDKFLPFGAEGDGSEAARSIASYLKNVRARVSLFFRRPGEQRFNKLLGLNTREAEPVFAPEQAGGIRWLEGFNESLFESSRGACVVPEDFLAELFPGEEGYILELEVKSASYGKQEHKLTLPVAGTHNLDSENIYCPLGFVRDLCREKDLVYSYDSLRAQVKENRQLEELQALLGRYFTQVDPFAPWGSSGEKGIYGAVIYRDEQLKETLGTLEEDLRLLGRLRPLLTAAACGVAAFASYFFCYTRKKEAAIALAQGTGRGALVLGQGAEQLLQLLLALGTALLISRIGKMKMDGSACLAIGASALAGRLAAALRTSGRGCFDCLKENE